MNITGVFLILGGLCLIVIGHRLLKPAIAILLFLFGFQSFHHLGFIFDANVLLFGGIACGILLVFLGLCLQKIMFFAAGCAGGYFLSVYVLSLFLVSSGLYIGIVIAISILCGIIIAFVQKTLILTCFVGSFLLFLGIDYFANWGLYRATFCVLENCPVVVDVRIYIYVGLVILTTLGAVLVHNKLK